MKDAILVDVHETLLDRKDRIIKDVLQLIEFLDKYYYIIIYSSRYYTNPKMFYEEIKHHKLPMDNYLCNDFFPDKEVEDNAAIKEKLVKSLGDEYRILFAIDNDKHVLKMLRKKFDINTLKFKMVK